MEITNVLAQTVQPGQNVVFNETPVKGNCSVMHREGSGIVTLRGNTNQCRARFLVSFGGNISVPTGETVGAIELAIAIAGEPLGSATMIVTPAAVDEFFNVSAQSYVDVPKGCCIIVTIRNTSDIPVNVQNANLIVERVA